jgi:polygalacturonase
MAEASPQVPSGDHEQLARETIQNYLPPAVNDTNTPPLQTRPYGPLGGFGVGEGFTQLQAAHHEARADTNNASETWWMAKQQQLGSAPFAQKTDYRIWRNVKDYGAKGDGKTDDTAAINRAIADGGRCGPDCGTSTTVPAVVYFPSGKYLVSSPIIQYYNTQFLGDVSCTMRISLRPTI